VSSSGVYSAGVLFASNQPQAAADSITHSPIMLATVQRVIALDGGRVVADGPREKLVTLPAKKPLMAASSTHTA
jgi:hypothetical protein